MNNPEPILEPYEAIRQFVEELNEKGINRLIWIAMEMEARQQRGMRPEDKNES